MTAEDTDPGLQTILSSLSHSKNIFRRAPRRSRDNALVAIALAFQGAVHEAQEEWDRRLPDLDEGNYQEVFLECLDVGIERLQVMRDRLRDIDSSLPPRNDV